MSFLPEDDLKAKISLNLAPMIDFLFLMLIFFASLAVSRIMTLDTEIQLAKVKGEDRKISERVTSPQKAISLSISQEGKYNWITPSQTFEIATAEEIAQQLQLQHRQGQIAQDKSKTEIFVRIDRNAKWQTIISLLTAVRQSGFSIYALYEPEIA